MKLDEFIVTIFCEIDDFIKQNFPARSLRRRGPLPLLSDSEVITMEIVGEYLGLSTEKDIYKYFSRHWNHFFPHLPDRSNFVRQAANLWGVKQKLLYKLQTPMKSLIQITDSMPIKVCKFARARHCQLFQGHARFGKWFGQTFYGFRLHLKINRIGLIRSFELTPANVHDLKVLPELVQGDFNGWILADKGYRSKPMKQILEDTQKLTLHTPYRSNERNPEPLDRQTHKHLIGIRRLIETVNGQLEQHFHIKKIWARDLWHLTVRIVRKILSHTYCVLLNLRLHRNPLNLKSLVC